MSDSESEQEYLNNNDEEEYDNNNDDNSKLIKIVQNDKVIEFIGSINAKPGWTKCLYCDRFHPPSMYLIGMEYCGHCWGWLNSNQLDLEKGTYSGQNPISEIKTYLKETFKLHDSNKCVNVDCVYNKILNLEKNKKLHHDFGVELGFIKNPEPVSTTSIDSSLDKNQKKSYFNNNKKSKMINYKLSSISI